MTTTTATPTRLPTAVPVLALGIFCLGTSEFMLAGLLPEMARELGVTIPAAGSLISAFAIGMLLGAPIMALLTLRLPRKVTLVGSGIVFALAHLAGALTTSFGLLVTTRVVAAVACATFWAVASVTVVAVTPKNLTARGLGALISGITLANIVGVPAGTWVSDHWGWQSTFVAVAVLSVAATVAVALLVPETSTGEKIAIGALAKRELRGLTGARLWLAVGTTVAVQSTMVATFSYLSPLLTDVSGVASSAVPLVLLAFGLGSYAGITVGGRYADRDPLLNVVVSLVATTIALAVVWLAAPSAVAVVPAVVVWGFATFTVASAINARVFQHGDQAPNLVAGVNVAAFNIGNALGPWFGGLVITAGLGYRALLPLSMSLAVVGLLVAAASWRLERGRAQAPEAAPCPA
ncbi:Cmx/CmrA family chloramphenicol efflux MFS transporter [Aeromicrobium alkaliterrae]|uniref:MFS transporter n=1 Tax=Aeromicrobium alkaliterrae TaxID=302168 RepID=A0ABN2JRH5_9ACTN